MVEDTRSLDTFHANRASGLGATDSPKILGLSRWGSPLSVYLDKVDPQPPGEMSLAAWLGVQLEPVVSDLYVKRTGTELRADKRHHRHPRADWVVCHLDYRAKGNRKLLVECKTRSRTEGFGADGSSEVPADIFVQVQHEMAVTGATETHVAVLFGFQDFRIFPIQRDNEFIAALLAELQRFWHEHVVARVAPEAGPFAVDSEVLSRAFPADNGQLRTATPEQEMSIAEYVAAASEAKLASDRLTGAENRIKDIIREDSGLVSTRGTITWKRTKSSKNVVWRDVAQKLHDEIISEAQTTEEIVARQRFWDAVVATSTTEREGHRVFRFTPAKEES